MHNDDSYYIDGSEKNVCSDCHDNGGYWRCQSCEEEYDEDAGSIMLANGDVICDNCYESGDYVECEACQDKFHVDDTDEVNTWSEADKKLCGTCKEELGVIKCKQFGSCEEGICPFEDHGNLDKIKEIIDLVAAHVEGDSINTDDPLENALKSTLERLNKLWPSDAVTMAPKPSGL
jgi:uncharacterized CHY-type Zn-finger protein